MLAGSRSRLCSCWRHIPIISTRPTVSSRAHIRRCEHRFVCGNLQRSTALAAIRGRNIACTRRSRIGYGVTRLCSGPLCADRRCRPLRVGPVCSERLPLRRTLVWSISRIYRTHRTLRHGHRLLLLQLPVVLAIGARGIGVTGGIGVGTAALSAACHSARGAWAIGGTGT